MTNEIKYILAIIISITLTNCGYKLTDKQLDFKTGNIEVSGKSRINYKIKNAIKFQERINSNNIFNLKIKTDKKKLIEDKNSKNEVTKYKISLLINLKILNDENILIKEYDFEKSTIYDTASNYSINLDREKKAEDNLIEEINDDILNIFKNDL